MNHNKTPKLKASKLLLTFCLMREDKFWNFYLEYVEFRSDVIWCHSVGPQILLCNYSLQTSFGVSGIKAKNLCSSKPILIHRLGAVCREQCCYQRYWAEVIALRRSDQAVMFQTGIYVHIMLFPAIFVCSVFLLWWRGETFKHSVFVRTSQNMTVGFLHISLICLPTVTKVQGGEGAKLLMCITYCH